MTIKQVRDQILEKLNPEGGEGLTAIEVWQRIGMWAPITVTTNLHALRREGLVVQQRRSEQGECEILPSLWWRKG